MSDEKTVPERQELIVWLHSTKKTRPLQKYGYVYYISRRRKYAIVYVNADQVDQTQKKIESLRFVKSVDRSPRQEVNMDFTVALDEEFERISKLEKADNLFEQEN